MKSSSPDSAQAMQRVRVGMTGLLMVMVLIGLASFIFTSANREQPVTAVGASNAAVVANIADGNSVDKGKDEPLAELGVAPSTTSSTEQVNAAAITQQQQHDQR